MSGSTGVITYSQALAVASASRDDVSTCDSPRGHSVDVKTACCVHGT